jgi:hypothetical protein
MLRNTRPMPFVGEADDGKLCTGTTRSLWLKRSSTHFPRQSNHVQSSRDGKYSANLKQIVFCTQVYCCMQRFRPGFYFINLDASARHNVIKFPSPLPHLSPLPSPRRICPSTSTRLGAHSLSVPLPLSVLLLNYRTPVVGFFARTWFRSALLLGGK